MQPDDLVTAPPLGGTVFDPRVEATIVAQEPDRAERDFSDGSVRTFQRYRVRYEDGNEATWDAAWVRLR